MIKAKNIHKRYGEVEVLKGVDFEVKQGEIVSIVGASGAGKTTLLQILGTIEKPSQGSVFADDIDLFSLSDKKIAAFRNKNIGFVFQFHQLLPEFTASENIMLPAMIGGLDKKKAEERALELLTYLQLDTMADKKPDTLSGGEQQRVAVARALVNSPQIVLADEPSGNLDSVNARDLHELFIKLRDKYKQSFVIVTHNEVLADMSDRKLTMKDGLLMH
ncbi:MAG: ABC transporter ATP-binding protein [Vicingaceae bacterium]